MHRPLREGVLGASESSAVAEGLQWVEAPGLAASIQEKLHFLLEGQRTRDLKENKGSGLIHKDTGNGVKTKITHRHNNSVKLQLLYNYWASIRLAFNGTVRCRSPTWRRGHLWSMQLRQAQRFCGGKNGGLLLPLSQLAEHRWWFWLQLHLNWKKKKKTEDDQISAEPQVCYQVFLVLE